MAPPSTLKQILLRPPDPFKANRAPADGVDALHNLHTSLLCLNCVQLLIMIHVSQLVEKARHSRNFSFERGGFRARNGGKHSLELAEARFNVCFAIVGVIIDILSIIVRRALLRIATRSFEFGFDLLFGFWGLLRQMSAVTAIMPIMKKNDEQKERNGDDKENNND
jgi:hypothetical protein